jgi:hypothetical protein
MTLKLQRKLTATTPPATARVAAQPAKLSQAIAQRGAAVSKPAPRPSAPVITDNRRPTGFAPDGYGQRQLPPLTGSQRPTGFAPDGYGQRQLPPLTGSQRPTGFAPDGYEPTRRPNRLPPLVGSERPIGINPNATPPRIPTDLAPNARLALASFRVNAALGRSIDVPTRPATQLGQALEQLERRQSLNARQGLKDFQLDASAIPEGTDPLKALALKAKLTGGLNGVDGLPPATQNFTNDEVEAQAERALDDVHSPVELAETLASDLPQEVKNEIIRQVVEEQGANAPGSVLGPRTYDYGDILSDPTALEGQVLSPEQRRVIAESLAAAHAEQPFSEEQLLELAPYLPDLAASIPASQDGGIVEAIGEALEARGEEGDAAMAAFAFTSSPELIAEHYPDVDSRATAFELLNNALPDSFHDLIGEYGTDARERMAANITRLFAFDTQGLLDKYLATGNMEESPLATFFANTLLNPEFANVPFDIPVDGQGSESISELINRRIEEYSGAIFEQLGQTTGDEDHIRANLADKLGRLSAAVLGGATQLLREGEAENESMANLITSTLGALLPDFPGKDAVISSLGDVIRDQEVEGAEAAEEFAEQLATSFELVLEDLEAQLHTGVLTNSFVSAFNYDTTWLELEND